MSKLAFTRHNTPLFYVLPPRPLIFLSLGATYLCPQLPNPIVATGFYAARQPGQLSQGADLPPPHEEQRVAADVIDLPP